MELREEEIADVSLATFYVFDKEASHSSRSGVRLAMGGMGGCGGCCAGCGGCGACWAGSYYTPPAFGYDGDPRPVRPKYYAHKPAPKKY
jgi:hypothetical protein